MNKTTTLGQNIKNRREELGLTLKDVSDKLGLKSPNSIAKIERGETAMPQIKTLEALSAVLGASIATLMGVPPIMADSPTETIIALTRSLRVFLLARSAELEIDSRDETFLKSLSVTIAIPTPTSDWWDGQLRLYRKHLKHV